MKENMDNLKSKSETEAKIESDEKFVEFSQIVKIELGEMKNEIKFILKSGEIITEDIKSCVKFVDPAYDSVFKTIFGNGNLLEERDGSQRLLNLLNSLIFPNEESKCFTEVKSISNEKGKITKKQDNSGIMRFDICCKAKILDKKKKTTKIIDVEMQIGKKTDILSRMDKYAHSLYQIYKTETILIAFMNHDYINEQNRSQSSHKVVFNSKGEIIKEDYDVEVIIVNLKEEIKKYQDKENIFLCKNKLGEAGISWLKLLGIRQWAENIKKFYYLPKNVRFLSKELESAFKLLQSYDEGELIQLLRKEEEDDNIIKVHEKEGEIKGKMNHTLGSLLKLFETQKENFDKIIDIIDYEKSDFKTKDIEEMIQEKEKRDEFINLLGKKRKID